MIRLSGRARAAFFIIVAACAVTMLPVEARSQAGAQVQEKVLKHKVAVGRFTNETVYGRSLLRDQDLDPLGKQAADILATYLTQTGKFLIFERPDLTKIEREQARVGGQAIGVDTLILGSVVEFGRATDGKRGFLNKKKVQRAHAKVAIRLVDVRTGLVFHSVTGEGDATTQTGTVLGMGSTAKYDATLSDKAISAAVENLIEGLVNTMSGRQWRTDILQVKGKSVFVSGGARQGLQVGDRLDVMRQGETIKSGQTGFDITLPAEKVAEIEVVSLFGDSETNEGAVTRLVSGTIESGRPSGLFVAEPK